VQQKVKNEKRKSKSENSKRKHKETRAKREKHTPISKIVADINCIGKATCLLTTQSAKASF
jgi:hypothetical protein